MIVILISFTVEILGDSLRNAVVLIDQIDKEIQAGKDPYLSVVDSSVSRLRPIIMASLTTVLGISPLIFDRFFRAMAVTIMSGLTFATVLTLIVVPVLYTSLFKIGSPEK
jgi:multidrug efflux pump subunit AcrB